jgi:isopenicillin-N epimerase
MIGSMAAVPLPPAAGRQPDAAPGADPLQVELLERWHLEVPVIPWPAPPDRLIRISAQVYNRSEEYRQLADALSIVVARESVSLPSR